MPRSIRWPNVAANANAFGALGIALGHVRDSWDFEAQIKREAGAAECLAVLLKDNTALLSINVSKNDLGAEAGKAIAEGIHDSRSLTQIDLSNNALCGLFYVEYEGTNGTYNADGGIKAIADAIGVSPSLTQINLAGNSIGAYFDRQKGWIPTPEGSKAIADAIRVSRSLTVADLRFNQLDT
eukprot:1693096-Prymnesium_polylepis.1